MDTIEEEFASEVIQPTPNSLKMYNEETAVKIIQRCKELGYFITNIETFRVDGVTTQPFIEHSIDYMFWKYGSKGIGCWDEAIDFIISKHQYGFVFEIFYWNPDEPVQSPIPDFLSMSKDTIDYWIHGNWLLNVNVFTEYSNDIEAGKVIRYKINDSSITDRIKKGTPIEIVISKGKVPHA